VQDAHVGDKIFSQHNNSGILNAGDIESMPFIEALGQFSYRVGEKTFISLNIFYSCFNLEFTIVICMLLITIDLTMM
jgi:hypothetical protein